MGRDSTHVRVSRATLVRLRAAVQSVLEQAEMGRYAHAPINPEPINPRCPGLSMDGMIGLLLDELARHRERGRRQSRRRRKSAGLDNGAGSV